MPELPDLTVYIEAIEARILGRTLQHVRLFHPFLLRSVEPALDATEGRRVFCVRRLGKRIAIGLENDLFLVLHLMIAGRLLWAKPGAKSPGKIGLAAFDFDNGSLLITEAGSKKRAALHLVQGDDALRGHDPGGLEVLDADLATFRAALTRENHTLKRSLTDPRIFSGIGNAYSDEILHHARLSPFKQTTRLDDDEVERLFIAVRETLREWTARLRAETGESFPTKVTAFREVMAVHGRYRKPCPVCASPVQRIVYSGNEANYCANCQTGGKLLADRALSRLLRQDWPKSLEELERLR
jgi:formamidopyrimidine-DNA glycosylase